MLLKTPLAPVLRCAVIIIALFSAACSVPQAARESVPEDLAVSSSIVKSDSDRREYRYLTLPNQLRVLLVSDTKTDKAAASLDVHVGSAQDPQDYQGLAHFLEHMLFLGTERFPTAGEYQAFINAHGGSHNAFTSFEHTNYFFDIDADYLPETLDRFADFFISPLFTEEYVGREVNAVSSEYSAKIKDEGRRSLDVFKRIVDPEHPFAKFSVGNLQTLPIESEQHGSLRQQLLKFYQRYYSANLMTLVVVGKESLDELEAMIEERFAAVPNKNVSIANIDTPMFSEGTLPLYVEIKPLKQQRILSLAFPVESETPYYRDKPLQYLGNILGHEGAGSLLSYLKSKGWVEGLSAGVGLSYRGGSSFNISIKLTSLGVSQSDAIVTAVFQAIHRIAEFGDQPWLYKEQRAINVQQFRYKEFPKPAHYALGLAGDMHYFSKADILRGSYLMEQYDWALIQRFLAKLTPENSIISLNAPEVSTDKTTALYQVDYRLKPIAEKQLAAWQGAGVNSEIKLPQPNIFVASDLSLKSSNVDSKGDRQNTLPEPLLDSNGMRLWFKQDADFNLPKGSVFFSFRTPLAVDTVQNQVLLKMYVSMVIDQLNELSYPALLANLNYSLHQHSRGFSVKINGFNDKQQVLLDQLLHALVNPELDATRFSNIKKEHERGLENRSKQQPYHLAMAELPELLYRQQHNSEQLLAAYQSLTLKQLRTFAKQLYAVGEIDMLVHGNYLADEARAYSEQVAGQLLNQHRPAEAIEILELSGGSHARIIDSDYADAVVLFYLQAKDLSLARRAAMGVTAQLLRADFYSLLRTEKQLGYIVTSGAYPMLEVPGLMFLVQSPVAGPGQLQTEIGDYLKQKQPFARDLTKEQFASARDTLILRLSESPKNLAEQSERYWQDIARSYYGFDSRDKLIAALEGLTLAAWQQYFAEDVISEQRKGLWIYSNGKFQQQVIADQLLDDVQGFKGEQPHYSFP